MVRKRDALLHKIEELYREVERKIIAAGDLTGTCRACGKCCDFDSFGHKLFLSSLELIYFKSKLDVEELKPMLSGVCPYNIKGKCSVHEIRFLGCRIFCCTGDENFQSELTEFALKRIKSICKDENIPYQYASLSDCLSKAG